MILKKYFSLLGVLGVMGILSACSSQENGTAQSDNQAASGVQAASQADSLNAPPKTYRVGISFTNPPYNQRQKEQLDGLDMDVMNAIARNQKFNVEYVQIPAESLMIHAKKENLSAVMNGLSADDLLGNPEYVLSHTYMSSSDCLMIHKPEMNQTWQQNKIALIQNPPLEERLATELQVDKTNFRHVQSVLHGLQELVNGHVQSVVGDCSGLRFVSKNPLFKAYKFQDSRLFTEETPQATDIGFGVNQNDTEFLNKINTGLQNIIHTGELEKIIKKWY